MRVLVPLGTPRSLRDGMAAIPVAGCTVALECCELCRLWGQ